MKMKLKFSILLLTALLLLGLSTSTAFPFNSVNYLGKTTWTFTITDHTNTSDIGQSVTITGGISKVGDEFYQFYGYFDPNNGPVLFTGGGVMIGDNLIFTLTQTQEHTDSSWRDGAVIQITIDKSTQSGTFYSVGHSFNKTTRTYGQYYGAGTVTRLGSPIPMSSVVVPQNLLLLQ
jgi:hypothetical protein